MRGASIKNYVISFIEITVLGAKIRLFLNRYNKIFDMQ